MDAARAGRWALGLGLSRGGGAVRVGVLSAERAARWGCEAPAGPWPLDMRIAKLLIISENTIA
jgi:hypothetical protein